MKSMVKSQAVKNGKTDTIRVLLVEDDPFVVDYLRELLADRSRPSYECTVAHDLAQGLALLRQAVFDVVLLDLGLPDSQGLDTAFSVRQQVPTVPLIVLTGLDDEEIAVRAQGMDIQDYLMKGQISGPLLQRSIRYAIERKRTLDELREREENYRGLFDTMTEAFAQCEILLDDAGKPVDFRYLNMNKAWERLTGFSAFSALGKTARELVPDVDQAIIDMAGSVALTGKPVLFEQYNKRLDTWFEVYMYCPERGFFASFSRDITEHKKAEEALRESEERLRIAAQAANFGSYDINIEAGMVFLSPALMSLFGMPPDSPARVPLPEGLRFVHPEDLPGVQQALERSMDPRSGGRFGLEHRIIRTDGSLCWVNMRGETFFQGTGEQRRPVRAAGVLMDITERKRAEAALRDSEERYRGLVHAASSAVWRVSADGTRMLEFTGDVANVCREPESVRGDWLDYIHPDDRARSLETWQRALAHKTLYEVEHRNLHRDGTYHYFLSRGVPVLDRSGEVREWIGFSVDITERKRAEQALRDSEERFRTLADNIAQLAWMADESGCIFWYNKRWFDYTGVSHDEMQGRGWRRVHHPDHRRRVITRLGGAFRTGEAWEDTFPLRAADGTYRWFLARAIPIRNEQGKVVRWFGTHTDITDRKRMEEEIKRMAQHDTLTGLPNRRLFNEIIHLELAQARRSGRKVALLFLDLDRFKEINDTLGHEAGDELLKQTALRLRSSIRTSDTVARIGGDEFNVLIPDIVHPEYASEVAHKILNEIRKPFEVKTHELAVSTSIGISIFPDDNEEVDTLMRYADIAMYYAKEHGRNMLQFYNPVINTRSLERMKLENSLRRAIAGNEFRLHYQPLVSVVTGRILAGEVLLRWQHPERGLLLPGQFLEAAEDIGFMSEIDEWVLRTAASQIRRWLDEGFPPVCITVNLSNRQFQNPDLIPRVGQILRETGMPAGCLDLEISEAVVMSSGENALARLGALARMGVQISVDNFGTGYSSLNQLRRLPIGKLKMDRSFVRDIADDSDDRAIVSAVLLLAHSLKLKVVASGVEQDSQLMLLRDLHCDEAQGYLFSRPLPAEQFRELLAA